MQRTLLLLCLLIPASLSPKEPPPPRAVRIVGNSQALSRAIARLEGWGKPGTLVRRLMNPGALTYAGQAGATNEHGYAAFKTELEGWQALREDLVAKQRRGMDVPAIARARCGTDQECDAERYVVLLCRMVSCPKESDN